LLAKQQSITRLKPYV